MYLLSLVLWSHTHSLNPIMSEVRKKILVNKLNILNKYAWSKKRIIRPTNIFYVFL